MRLSFEMSLLIPLPTEKLLLVCLEERMGRLGELMSGRSLDGDGFCLSPSVKYGFERFDLTLELRLRDEFARGTSYLSDLLLFKGASPSVSLMASSL